MRKDYVVYAAIMLLIGTGFAWVVYPYWRDAISYGVPIQGINIAILVGLVLATAVSVVSYISGVVVLLKSIREQGE